jgi:predicted TIM-barrel fold metal-dependent hydrolase
VIPEAATPVSVVDGRYVVISSDGHAGADILDYRPYLEAKYLEEFDAWAAAYQNPFGDLRSRDADRNWDSARRLRELEDDGIVAEVLFPNTVPPFFTSSGLVMRPPSSEEFELRWAGLKAHNRWLADFCADTPGRRAGIAQVFLNDVEAAVAEVEWAREAGLFGGVLVPGVPPDSDLPPLHSPDYEPLWAVCEDLGMPVNNHSGSAGPEYGPYDASMALFMFELGWYSHRLLWSMIFAGVFERHPGLKLVLTEQSVGWVPGVLSMMDHTFARFRTDGTAESYFGGALAKAIPRQPSEYWARQCYGGASFFRRSECDIRDQIGVPNIMWGQDYPHIEGTYPYTREALRSTFAGVDRAEVAAMVGGNAVGVYGFDLDLLRDAAARVGPGLDEIDVPLDEVPADSRSKAFAGEALKPW